jgi:hypothetical protein
VRGRTWLPAIVVVWCGLALGLASCRLADSPPGNPVAPVLDTTGPLAPGGGSNGAGSVIGSGAGAESTRRGR